jgi:hypothetical protein
VTAATYNGAGLDAHVETVCPQSSQGNTLQTQPVNAKADFATTSSDRWIGAVGVLAAVSGEIAVAASKFGIHRKNGLRSATSWIYQTLRMASQRAARALTESFSAKGVTKLILMAELSMAGKKLGVQNMIRRQLPYGRIPSNYPSHATAVSHCKLRNDQSR